MLDSWDENTKTRALFGLGFDYLYMLSYSLAIAFACFYGAVRRGGWFGRLGVLLGWSQFVAAGLDAIENLALLTIFLRGSEGPWAALSFWCAAPKFALVLAGLLYAAAAALAPGRVGRKSVYSLNR